MKDYKLEDMTLANPSVFDAQKEDVDKTIEVLETVKNELNPSWAKENVEATLELVREKRRRL